MTSKQPKTQLEQFIDEVNRANTIQELKNILNRLETYSKLYPSDKANELLAYVYYLIGDFKKSLEIISMTDTPLAKYIEALVRTALSEFKTAYNILEELKNYVNEEFKMKILSQQLLILASAYELEAIESLMENVDEEQIKAFLYEESWHNANLIFSRIYGYRKAKEYLSKNKELLNVKNEIEKIVNKYSKEYKVIPLIEEDIEDGTKDLHFIVILPNQAEKRKDLEKLEIDIIENIYFKYKIDESFYYRIVHPIVEGESIVFTNRV